MRLSSYQLQYDRVTRMISDVTGIPLFDELVTIADTQYELAGDEPPGSLNEMFHIIGLGRISAVQNQFWDGSDRSTKYIFYCYPQPGELGYTGNYNAGGTGYVLIKGPGGMIALGHGFSLHSNFIDLIPAIGGMMVFGLGVASFISGAGAIGDAAATGSGAVSLTSEEVAALYSDAGYSGIFEAGAPGWVSAEVGAGSIGLESTAGWVSSEVGAGSIGLESAVSTIPLTSATSLLPSLQTAGQIIGVASGTVGLVNAVSGRTPTPGHTPGVDTPLYGGPSMSNPAPGTVPGLPLFGSSNTLLGVAAVGLFGLAFLQKDKRGKT